jgi:valyl-tRNA synthetase
MPHSPGQEDSIMVSRYPSSDPSLDFSDAAEFEKVIELIGAIRARRGEMNVPPGKRVSLTIESADIALFESCAAFFEKLAGCVKLAPGTGGEDCVVIVTAHARAFLPLGELIDKEKELARLEKELEKAQKDVEFIGKKLENQGFITKAPPAQVENERNKLAAAQEKLAGIEKSLAALR